MLLIVSGAPGTGKSTLAHSVGRALSWPVISRDEIRSGVVHAGTPDDGFLLTYRLFQETVSTLARAGASLVAEAAFQDRNWRPLLGLGPTRILRCVTTPEVARARVVVRPSLPGEPISVRDWVPISSEAPTLIVDTTDGYSPAFAEVVEFARQPQ